MQPKKKKKKKKSLYIASSVAGSLCSKLRKVLLYPKILFSYH